MQDDCLFCRMASGAMDVPKLLDWPDLFVIRDINPRAPAHCLVIPRRHIPTMDDVRDEHGPILARMCQAASEAAKIEGIFDRGYRVAFNVRGDSGMTIFHLHMHVVGGRKLGPEG